jgi:hypothetical protein
MAKSTINTSSFYESRQQHSTALSIHRYKKATTENLISTNLHFFKSLEQRIDAGNVPQECRMTIGEVLSSMSMNFL